MLQIALLLLALGLYKYMSFVNTSAAYTLIILTGLGALLYAGFIIAGAYSYDCPFQPPGSASLRWICAKLRFYLPTLLKKIQPRIPPIWRSSPLVAQDTRTCAPQLYLSTTREVPRLHDPWFTQNELAAVQMDAPCVSWILSDITDPEALDAAIQMAGLIWWFEDGINVEPLYDSIVSTFHTCFGPNMVLYPRMRDRAYYSGRAILWIHALAARHPKEGEFPLPTIKYMTPAPDCDLAQLLSVIQYPGPDLDIEGLLRVDKTHTHTPSHSQWISGLLLHLSSATQTSNSFDLSLVGFYLRNVEANAPLDVVLNRLLMCCNLLRSPGEELKIQDKLYGIPCSCHPSYSYHCSLAIA